MKTPTNLTEVKGDLFDFISKGYYIGHQCNCVSEGVGGLANAIYKKYPMAHIRKKVEPWRFGTADIIDPIINIYSQKYTGSPNATDDSVAMRFQAFDDAWEGVMNLLPFTGEQIRIAVPYKYGSDLAGGHWPDYYAKFVELARKNPDIDFLIVERNF